MRIRTWIGLGLACLCGMAPLQAAPQLAWIFPAGGSRGQTVTVQLHGSNLDKLHGVLVLGQGIRAELLPVAPATAAKGRQAAPAGDDKSRSLRLTINPDVPFTNREVRVYDASGISNPLLFQVGQWPEILEQEPNETPETAQRVDIPVTINAKIQAPGDQDCYRFTAHRGQAISCEVYAERLYSWLGNSWLEGHLEALDPHGKRIALNDGRYHWDPAISFVAPEDGDYTILLRDLLWRGSPLAAYRLIIGPVPHVDTVFPAGGRRGSTVQVAFTGENLPAPASEMVKVSDSSDDDNESVSLHTAEGDTNAVSFNLGDFPEVVEQEPNDTVEQAQPVQIPVTINGRMDKPGDRDCFRFHANARQTLALAVFANRGGSPMDPYLTLRDMQGRVLRENDDAYDRDSLISYTFPAAGDFVVEIRDIDDRGGADFVYRLSLGEPQQNFKLTVSPDRVAVPMGGAARLDVRLNRRWGYNGDVRVHIDNLPPGITASPAFFPRGVDRCIVTLQQGTPAGGTPVSTGSGAAGIVPAAAVGNAAGVDGTGGASPGRFPAMLQIVGEGMVNGQDVRHTASALETYYLDNQPMERPSTGPFAILAAPASLALQAKIAAIDLQAGGSAEIPVRIVRAPGNRQSFTLKIDGLPAGVKSESVRVAVDAQQASITLKADGAAAPAQAQIVASAMVTGSDGKDLSIAVTSAIPFQVKK